MDKTKGKRSERGKMKIKSNRGATEMIYRIDWHTPVFDRDVAVDSIPSLPSFNSDFRVDLLCLPP